MLRFIPLHRAIFTYFKDYFSYLVMKRVIFFKVQLCTPTFRNRKGAQKIFAAQTPPRKRGFLSTHQTIVGKTFQAPPKFVIFARRCSALLDGAGIYAQVGWHNLGSYAMSRYGLRKLLFRLKSAILMRYYTVNRTRFSARLAYRQETWFKCYFYVYKKLCAKL